MTDIEISDHARELARQDGLGPEWIPAIREAIAKGVRRARAQALAELHIGLGKPAGGKADTLFADALALLRKMPA